jgi:hypothetical protein
MIKTTYLQAFNHFNLSVEENQLLGVGAGSTISFGSSLTFYDIFNFKDPMDIAPTGFLSKSGFTTITEAVLNGVGYFPPLDDENFHVSPETVQGAMASVTKAMLAAILDNNGKRSTTVGIGSSRGKAETVINTLKQKTKRDLTVAPYNTWRDSVGIITPTSISRTNNVAIVTTTPAHGLSTAFDDWGVVMNLNSGIGTASFNISTSTYPNGVPIRIIDSTTFAYANIGINTDWTNVSGTADVRVGWGGTSINLHLYYA